MKLHQDSLKGEWLVLRNRDLAVGNNCVIVQEEEEAFLQEHPDWRWSFDMQHFLKNHFVI